MHSAAAYAARLDAVEAQAARLVGTLPLADPWGGGVTARFRLDPARPPEPELTLVGSYLSADDVLLDVGGGAGRFSLPLAARCHEVVNVDPSPGMVAAFRDAARAAGIGNARAVEAEWSSVDETGDVAVAVNVTYFVRDIVPFVEKLQAAARKRVAIIVAGVPPPANFADLFRLLFDELPEARPGHRELLSVLWDLGILPDVHVMPLRHVQTPPYPTREAAIAGTLETLSALLGADANRHAELRDRLDVRFDRVFRSTDAGFERLPASANHFIVITWVPTDRSARP